MQKITLYQFTTCPYCAKVRSYLESKGIEFETVNVEYDREDPLRKTLFEKSGIGTVPVIEVDGKFIGESDKIIAYLDEHL